MKLLHIDSSILSDQSATRVLSAKVVARWRQLRPDTTVEYLDLHRTPLAHLDGAALSGSDARASGESERILQQFLAADVVVVGAPMYNFGVPCTLKAWIDRIAVAGRTFRYTAEGPVGLAGGRRVIVATAAGGLHAGQATDFVEPYLRQVFAFIGIGDVEFIRAEGLALSPQHRADALARAMAALPSPLPLAA